MFTKQPTNQLFFDLPQHSLLEDLLAIPKTPCHPCKTHALSQTNLVAGALRSIFAMLKFVSEAHYHTCYVTWVSQINLRKNHFS